MLSPLFTIFLFLFLLCSLIIFFVKPLQKITRSIIIAAVSSISVFLAVFIFLFDIVGWRVISTFLLIMVFILPLIILISVGKIVWIARGLILKRIAARKDAYRTILVYSIIALTGSLMAIPNIYVFIPHTYIRPNEAGTKSNMHTLHLCMQDFSSRAEGCFPSKLNTSVMEVMKDINKVSYDSTSITGFDTHDTIFTENIGAFGISLLPANGGYKNIQDNKKPVLILSHDDPPMWAKSCVGAVYYVPLEVKGNIAKSYKIYGAGEKGLHNMIIQAGDL